MANKFDEVKERGKERLAEMKVKAKQIMDDAKEKARPVIDFCRENPKLVASAAITIGGALLKSSYKAKEERAAECKFWDPRSCVYWTIRRPMTSAEKKRFLIMRNEGRGVYEALSALNLDPH